MKTVLLTLCCTLLASCSWVKPGPNSGQVALSDLEDINFCRKLGEASVNTLAQVGPYDRSATKVAEELVQLARNEAELMGGDTLAPLNDMSDGAQRFGVYQCEDQSLAP